MNKFRKTIIATLGGVNAIFNISLPILVALLVITVSNISYFSQITLTSICILSTIYRAIRIWL